MNCPCFYFEWDGKDWDIEPLFCACGHADDEHGIDQECQADIDE